MEAFNELARNYGIWVALGWLAWQQYGSRVLDTLFVERKERREQEARQEQEERDRIERYEREDRLRAQETYDRFSKSMDRFADTLNLQSQTMIVISERMNRTERDLDYMRTSMATIAERVGIPKADPKN